MSLDARLAVTGVALLLLGSGLFLRTGVSEAVSVVLAALAAAGLVAAAVGVAFHPRRAGLPDK